MTANKTISLDNVEKFVIYGSGKKLCEIERFVPYRQKKNRFDHLEVVENRYEYDIKDITLKNGIKNARKENLDRKDNYFLPYTEKYWTNAKYYTLYIHESEISVNDCGDLLAMETEEEKNYLHGFMLSFNNPVEIVTYHCERLFVEKNWSIPDNGIWGDGYGTKDRPCYDTFDTAKSLFCMKNGIKESGVFKRWKETETRETLSMLTTARYYTKREFSEERKRKVAIAEALNNSKLFRDTFSYYDIEKLEKVLGKLSIAAD